MAAISENLTKGVQNLITKDWEEFFPDLGSVKPMDLSRRVGPLLISMSLEKNFDILGHSYRPNISVHNLSRPFQGITALLRVYLPSPEHEDIKCKDHNQRYHNAIRIFKEIAPIPLDGPISLNEVFEGYANFEPSYKISWLQDPVLIAAWAGEKERAYQYLDWANNIFKMWPEDYQVDLGGKNWREKMEEKIKNPEELREITRQEVIKHKLEKVPYRDLGLAV